MTPPFPRRRCMMAFPDVSCIPGCYLSVGSKCDLFTGVGHPFLPMKGIRWQGMPGGWNLQTQGANSKSKGRPPDPWTPNPKPQTPSAKCQTPLENWPKPTGPVSPPPPAPRFLPLSVLGQLLSLSLSMTTPGLCCHELSTTVLAAIELLRPSFLLLDPLCLMAACTVIPYTQPSSTQSSHGLHNCHDSNPGALHCTLYCAFLYVCASSQASATVGGVAGTVDLQNSSTFPPSNTHNKPGLQLTSWALSVSLSPLSCGRSLHYPAVCALQTEPIQGFPKYRYGGTRACLSRPLPRR